MHRVLLALAMVVLTSGWASAITLSDKMHARIAKGNQHFESGEHEQALKEYLEAQQVDSTHSVPHFNAGDALYRLGKFPEGARKFLKSASSLDDSISAMSYYNLGNAMFKAGDLKSAVEAYRKSLLINPDDEDAKFNLEFAMRMMQEQSSESSEQSQDRQEQEDAQDKQEGKEQQQGTEQQQQQQGQEEQPKPAPQQEQTQQAPEESQDQPTPGEITHEDLERILAAIEASDRNTQEELLKKASRRRRITGKDW